MENTLNPLRELKLSGKANDDFQRWYQKVYQNNAFDIETWNYHTQREYYSKFFGILINNSNDFYIELERYNSRS